MADFKFGNDQCAKRLSGTANYLSILTRNLHIARQQGRLIVRHLLLPGHLECCFKPAVRWLLENLPDVDFSLREGYLPSWRSGQFVELGRPLGRVDVAAAHDFLRDSPLKVIQ